MSSLNKVILIGNLGKEPEIKHFEGGGLMARFSLATSDFYKGKDGQRVEHTEWHHIVMFRTLAENVEKLQMKKGQLVCIEGRIRTRSWEDRDGKKHSMTEILAEGMNLLGKRMTNENGGTSSTDSGEAGYMQAIPPPSIPESGPDTTGDLPF